MNTLLISLILIPAIEIYLFIKIGSYIGAFYTIALIFITAFIGVMYARHEGFNNFRSGFGQLVKNEIPIYEIISGATIGIGALLLIIPGFATDTLGVLLIFPLSRRIILAGLTKKFNKKKTEKNDFVEGEFEDIDEDNDRKI